MKISLNWLSQYIDLAGLSVDEMSDMLTFAGIEVEDIRQQGVDSPYVVVARVASAEQHPQADRLKVCQVDVGDGTLHQIVCGAQNYKVGDKVPCALPGAVLPGNFEIKVGKLRGVESRGMLCSASELGLPDKEHGLWILPQELEIGTPISQVVKADTMVEVEVTPNRPDLLSHNGMAYELAAISGREYRPVSIDDAGVELEPAGDFVRLDQPDLNPYYTAVKISGVKVQESPEWLKERLVAIGLRPINNIVDVTNYVLHELGTPLHAFDAAKVQGGIVTRHRLRRGNLQGPGRAGIHPQLHGPGRCGPVRQGARHRRRDGRGGKRRDGRHYGRHSGIRLVQALLRARHVPQADPVFRLLLPL